MLHDNDNTKPLIAITGGIGAGKSVVARLLRHMGYEVYDCDSRAQELMRRSPVIINSLTQRYGPQLYLSDGTLDRARLSSIIFNDKDELLFVNGVVHPVVRDDILRWHRDCPAGRPAFVETAILKEGGLDRMVNAVWNVTAPQQLRIMRVMRRNAATRRQVEQRIKSQSDNPGTLTIPVVEIVNDNISPILPQVIAALKHNNGVNMPLKNSIE